MTQYTDTYSSTARGSSAWRILKSIVLVLSIMLNLTLIAVVVVLGATVAAGRPDAYRETVIQPGPEQNKIAVVNINGMIDERQWQSFQRQLAMAQGDENVAAVLLRVSSPGGMISSSDRVYNRLMQFRDARQIPTLALMESMATSGGYYVALGCEAIMAEPTAITGSIGAVMYHFQLEELLSDRLGIRPTVIKSAPRKDWPGIFSELTDQQQQYLEEKLINPFHERFVDTVVAGRQMLDFNDVAQLADGSIFTADEALGYQLIDAVGYMDQAIETVMEMAGIDDARVVEYRRPFAFTDIFMLSSNKSTVSRDMLFELAEPRLMYLWNGQFKTK